LWQRVTELPRQHSDLPPMMRVVRNQVCEEGSYVRLESFNAPVTLQSAF
jgi:hypothetical protein